jgi:choline-sulfatase
MGCETPAVTNGNASTHGGEADVKRRDFIKAAGIAAGSAMTTGLARAGMPRQPSPAAAARPNIVVITTDQQSADALSCRMGSTFLRTPAMDGLAAHGTFFSRAYSANPLCIPARTAMLTGQCPHVTGLQTNDNAASLAGKFKTYGTLLREAGYDTAYFGKWHVPYPRPDGAAHGFKVLGANRNDGIDAEVPPLAEAFISQPRSGPFLLVTSFVNPHNICEWARGEDLKNGPVGDPPALELCPPAVKNLQVMKDEPDIIPLIRQSYQSNRLFPVGNFDERKWRQYRWAYFRMIEMVDAHIGRVIRALRDAGQYENTLIVFTSDHGDCQGAHGWNQKTVLFDESSRVPLVVKPPGAPGAGTCDLLVNIGLDLLPTLCSFAGVVPPAGLPGESLQDVVRDSTARHARPYIVVENKMVQGDPVGGEKPEPNGRMVRSGRYKYCAYDLGTRRESLVDLDRDPGELVNLAADPSHRAVLAEHRRYLAEWCRTTRDPFVAPV